MARKQTNIRLEEHILTRLRAKAEAEGRSFSDVVREYLARGLREDGIAPNDEAPVLQGAAG